MNIAVFVSGNGTNLQALIDAEAKGGLSSGRISLVVSDKPGAFALERAKKAGIKTFVPEGGSAGDRAAYDRKVAEVLDEQKIELVVLAGYMRILSGYFIKKYRDRILNVHPALLPSFKGVHGIKDAYEYGVKVTGVTVHFVEEDLDAGPVIMQECVRVDEAITLNELEARIHEVEHRIYPEAVRLFIDGKLARSGRKVVIER